MFFHHIHLIFLDSCTDTLYPSEHELIRCISCLKVFCAQIFTWRNIRGKLLKAASFVIFIVTSNIIVGIGADRVWAHIVSSKGPLGSAGVLVFWIDGEGYGPYNV